MAIILDQQVTRARVQRHFYKNIDYSKMAFSPIATFFQRGYVRVENYSYYDSGAT